MQRLAGSSQEDEGDKRSVSPSLSSNPLPFAHEEEGKGFGTPGAIPSRLNRNDGCLARASSMLARSTLTPFLETIANP